MGSNVNYVFSTNVFQNMCLVCSLFYEVMVRHPIKLVETTMPSLTTLRLLTIVLLSEISALILWYICFTKLYVWRDILNEKKNINYALSFKDKLKYMFTKPPKVQSILKVIVTMLFLLFSLFSSFFHF